MSDVMNGCRDHWSSAATIGWALAIFLLAGCSTSATTPASRSPDPTAATVDVGRFQVTFALARTTLRRDEAIDGVATLRLLRDGPGALSGSGSGLFGFAFHEVGGAGRSIDPVFDAACAPYRIGVGQPITSAIVKSGGFSPDEPDAAFKSSFLADPVVRVPIGTWDVVAEARFIDGANCDGPIQTIDAAVRILVTE